jgi:hypothetical protein
MLLTEIEQEIIKPLSRPEKFQLVQFLVMELAQEETELAQYFPPGVQHGFWSPTDAYEAAANLQKLLQESDV